MSAVKHSCWLQALSATSNQITFIGFHASLLNTRVISAINFETMDCLNCGKFILSIGQTDKKGVTTECCYN